MYKKFLPKKKHLTAQQLNWIGHRIHDRNLWHLNSQSVPRGVAIGLFAAFIPLPIQMLLAVVVSAFCRANIPIAIASTWITNPVTFIPINYFIHDFGELLLGMQHQDISLQPMILDSGVHNIYDTLVNWAHVLGKPFIVALPIVALGASAIGYGLTTALYYVANLLKKRK